MKPLPVLAVAFAFAVLALAAGPARTAEGDGAAPAVPARDRDRPPAATDRAPDRPAAPDAAGLVSGPALERLMDYVQRTNPAEFERLTRLQHENPAEFREILRRRFQEAAESRRRPPPGWRPRAEAPKADRDAPEGGKTDRPNGDAAPRARTPAAPDGERTREATGERVRMGAHGGAGATHGFGRARGIEDSPEYRETLEGVRQLTEEYKRSKAADRVGIEQRLREKVGRLFDLRERERASQLDRMEKEIARLRKELEGRTELRAKIIDRRMDEMLGRDKTQW